MKIYSLILWSFAVSQIIGAPGEHNKRTQKYSIGVPGTLTQKRYTNNERSAILDYFISIQPEIISGLIQIGTFNRMKLAAKKLGYVKTPHWTNDYFFRKMELANKKTSVYARVPVPIKPWLKKKCLKLKKIKAEKRRSNGYKKKYNKYKYKCKRAKLSIPNPLKKNKNKLTG